MQEEPGQTLSAYRVIRDGIVAGRYAPGERLVEQAIAADAGLSRTPVREALRLLERDGLVRFERNRGAAVRALTLADLHDLYELRARLEAYAAELAAERRSAEQLSELEAAALDFEAAAAAHAPGRDFAPILASNARIHRRIADAAAQSHLAPHLERIVDNPLVLRAYRSFDRAELARSVLFHRLIVEAIGRRAGDRAGRLMAEHVLQARDVLIEQVRAAGGADAR